MTDLRFYETSPENRPAETEFTRGDLEQHFTLALITDEGFTYYMDIDECDENASVILYRPDGSLASDNYFAYSAMWEDMEAVYKGHTPAYIHEVVTQAIQENAKMGAFEE